MKLIFSKISVFVVGLALLTARLGHSQSTSLSETAQNTIDTPRLFDPASNSTNPSVLSQQLQNPFLGSLPDTGVIGPDIHLTLTKAISLALRSNLGLVDSNVATDVGKARRLKALSTLLPQLSADSQVAFETYDLSTIGATQINLPNRVGPFNYGNVHVSLNQKLIDRSSAHTLKQRALEERADEDVLHDARNVVVLAATSAYLVVTSDKSRLAAAQAEFDAAKSTADLLRDRVAHELSPEIDSIRAQVALETAKQRVTLARIHTQQDALALGRIIGVPATTEIVLDDSIGFSKLPAGFANGLNELALGHRADLAAAKARELGTNEEVRAAGAERLPVLGLTANYGGGGMNFGAFYSEYSVRGNLQVPIFTGGRIKADILEAKANQRSASSEVLDLQQRILFDVRTAELNLDGSDSSVAVAQKNIALAERGLKQSMDRLDAGVTLAQEVIDAQNTLATAKDNYIRSVYEHNLAKLLLIRATGTAEQDVDQYFPVRNESK